MPRIMDEQMNNNEAVADDSIAKTGPQNTDLSLVNDERDILDNAETLPTDDDVSAKDGAVTDDPLAQEDTSPQDDLVGPDTHTPSTELTTERVIEAILFATDTPLGLSKIVSILGTGSAREVRKMIQSLNTGYAEGGHAFRIDEVAGGYQILTLPEYNTWLRRVKQSRQETKLSSAAMETLAVIAYKQPVVRAEIEAIRGVSAGEMLHRLRELGLIKIVGRAEDIGRPMLYGTTRHFLEVFGLASLEDLPAVEELQPPKS